MRYMMIVKSDPETEATVPPASEFEAMGRYNHSLVDAGVLLAAEGLTMSKDGARVSYRDGKTSVKDGPFTEAKELVAGFWIIQVASLEEAVEWARRIPFAQGQVEVRKVAEAADFEDILGPEGVAREVAMRAHVQGQSS